MTHQSEQKLEKTLIEQLGINGVRINELMGKLMINGARYL